MQSDCHAGRIPDPDYAGKRSCKEFQSPAIDLDPHVAALGMTFYTGLMFPEN
jgi:glucose/arabinose dehydrogenase